MSPNPASSSFSSSPSNNINLLHNNHNHNSFLSPPLSRNASFSTPSPRQSTLHPPHSSSSPSSAQSVDAPRPSTAPGPQSTNSNYPSDVTPVLSTSKGSRVTRASSVRKSHTTSDLNVPKRPRPQHLNLSNPSSDNLSLSGLLSPTSIHPRATSSLSRSSSRSDRRSHSVRRPPASFSSNGIETSYGPPPALITSRNPYHSELARLAQNPAASTLAAQQQKPYNHSTFPGKLHSSKPTRSDSLSRPRSRGRTIDNPQHRAGGLLSPTALPGQTMDSLDAMMSQNRANWQHGSPSDQSFDLSPSSGTRNMARISDEGMASSQSSEDLFLKLANESQQKLPQQQSQPQQLQKHQREQAEMGEVSEQLENLQIRDRPNADRNSLNGEPAAAPRRRNSSPIESSALNRFTSQPSRTGCRSGAASVVGVSTRAYSSISPEQKLASYRARYNGPQTPKKTESTNANSRRASATEQLLARVHQQRQSRLNYATPTDSEYSPNTRSSFQQDHRTDGESVVSTVQSNVWDEMQELKSHVNRIEHSRGYASGVAGSNGSGERPRTATTTVTTISSSPKVGMGYKSGSGDHRIGPEIANIHPNLHQAMARCKTFVSPAIYRALESAAAEALEMAAASRSSAPNGSVYGQLSAATMSGERQMKRKADNICRNLTDLCVALIDGQLPQETPNRFSSQSFSQRRDSRDIHTPVSKMPAEIVNQRNYSRHQSLEPEDYKPVEARPSSSRALERLEARRVSLMANGTPASSSRETPQSATQSRAGFQDVKSSPLAATLLRSGTSLMRSRAQQQHQQQAEDEDEQRSLRTPSRAVTEVGSMLRKRGDRVSSMLGVNRNNDGSNTNQYISTQHSALRRVTGGQPSPTTPTNSSLLRGAGRFFGNDRLSTSDATEEDEKKVKRRSFGLYPLSTSSTTTSNRSHNLRPASLSSRRTSLTAE